MTTPIFAAFVRYQGTFIPSITVTDWWYGVVPYFPGGTTGTGVFTHTGPVCNAGLNGIDVNNLTWQVQAGAIGYHVYRKAGAAPVPGTDPIWFDALSETGVLDKGFPAATRS